MGKWRIVSGVIDPSMNRTNRQKVCLVTFYLVLISDLDVQGVSKVRSGCKL